MNGFTSYRNAKVETASPVRIVALLLQEAIRRIEMGAACLDRADAREALPHFHHASKVLAQLRTALTPQPGGEELVRNLDGLYTWCSSELVVARVDQDPARARAVGKALVPLLQGWNEVIEKGLA